MPVTATSLEVAIAYLLRSVVGKRHGWLSPQFQRCDMGCLSGALFDFFSQKWAKAPHGETRCQVLPWLCSKQVAVPIPSVLPAVSKEALKSWSSNKG